MDAPSSPVISSVPEVTPVVTTVMEGVVLPPTTLPQASSMVNPGLSLDFDFMEARQEYTMPEWTLPTSGPTMPEWTLPTSGPTRLSYASASRVGRTTHMADMPRPTLPASLPTVNMPSQPSRATSSHTDGALPVTGQGNITEEPLVEILRRLATPPPPPPPPTTDVLSQLLAALQPPPLPPVTVQPTQESAMTQLLETLRRQAPPPPPPTPTPAEGLAQLLQALVGAQPRVAIMPHSVMNSKFCDWIARYPLPDKQKVPTIVGTYDGTRDPDDHLALFEQAIMTEKWVDPVACHMFPGTLQGFARDWFTSLPERSIKDFEDLKHKFIYHFFHQKKQRRTHLEAHLLRQREGESIPDFIRRYTSECQKIHNLPESQQISGFIMSLLPGGLQEKLAKRIPITFKEATDSAYDYLRSRETIALTRGVTRNKQWTNQGGKDERKDNNRRDDRHRRDDRSSRRFHPFDKQTSDSLPLTKTPQEILQTEKVSNGFRPPPPLPPTRNGKRNTSKYCEFHEDNGHDTNACRELKSEIRRALEDGKLSHLVSGAKAQAAINPERKAYSWQAKGKDKVDHPGAPDGHILYIQDS